MPLRNRAAWPSIAQIATAFEIGMPTFFIAILVVIRHVINSNNDINCPAPLAPNSGCAFPQFTPFRAPMYTVKNQNAYAFCENFDIAYAPSGTDADQFMTNALAFLESSAPLNGTYTLSPFATADAAVTFLLQQSAADPAQHDPGCQAAVIFNSLASPIQDDLRFASTPGGRHSGDNTHSQNQDGRTDQAFPIWEQPGPRNDIPESPDAFGNLPGYEDHGFLSLQFAVNLGITQAANQPAALAMLETVQMQRIPYPPYRDDPFLNAIQFGFPLLLMLSLLYTALSIVRVRFAKQFTGASDV